MTQKYLRPRFFIIGERKCGTSSLYRYLLAHPLVLPARQKELQFFTQGPDYVDAHLEEYLAQFPRTAETTELTLEWPELDETGVLYHESVRIQQFADHPYSTGEASADTFFHVSPCLLQRHFPELKLIVILRDPVERAFSHHRMLHRFQAEGRDLGFTVGDFEHDMRDEMNRILAGESTPCLSPGFYLTSLQKWHRVWDKENFLLLFSSELADYEPCKAVMSRTLHHLDLPHYDYSEIVRLRYNQAPKAAMPSHIREELSEFYYQHSLALQRYLQHPLPWLNTATCP